MNCFSVQWDTSQKYDLKIYQQSEIYQQNPWEIEEMPGNLHLRSLFCIYEQNLWNTLVKDFFLFQFIVLLVISVIPLNALILKCLASASVNHFLEPSKRGGFELYDYILHNQPYNTSCHQKLEKQYNACLAITGVFRGISKKKLYQELGLESLENRRWFRKLCLFFKTLKNKSPGYLYSMTQQRISPYTIRNTDIDTDTSFYHYTYNLQIPFLQSTTLEWNNLDQEIRNCENYSLFHCNILKYFRSITK